MIVVNKSYSIIAGYYDIIMDHVDYKMWAEYLQSIYESLQINPQKIIDLSCGTGSLLANMDKVNCNLYGGDLSREMVEIASDKTSLPLACADLRRLPYRKSVFDVALVMYDTMNYIIENNDVNTVFSEIYHLLKPGGFFIFDVVTPYICEKEFDNYVENNGGYKRHSWYIAEDNKQFTEFTLWNEKKKQTELHEQNIRSLDEWYAIIDSSAFTTIDCLSEFSFCKGHDKSDRIHFICQKEL